jgi:hypothetical protein
MPYATDDDLIRALRDRPRVARSRARTRARRAPPATGAQLASAEARLGFALPPLLRRLYELANGGIGPGPRGIYPLDGNPDTLTAIYTAFVGSTYAPAPGDPGFAQYPWPARLLPICDWGCAVWSCLDCRSVDGPIVTSSNGEPFADSGHTLRSWLATWLDGIDLYEEMFEPAPTHAMRNPFTGEPVVIKGQGKPRGTRWVRGLSADFAPSRGYCRWDATQCSHM